MHNKECFCQFLWATACNEALFQNLPKSLHKIVIFPTLSQFFATLKMIQAKINVTFLIFMAFQAKIAGKLNFHPQNPSRFSKVHSVNKEPLGGAQEDPWYEETSEEEA